MTLSSKATKKAKAICGESIPTYLLRKNAGKDKLVRLKSITHKGKDIIRHRTVTLHMGNQAITTRACLLRVFRLTARLDRPRAPRLCFPVFLPAWLEMRGQQQPQRRKLHPLLRRMCRHG